MIILSISTVKYVEPDEYAVRKRKRGERDGGNNFYQKKKNFRFSQITNILKITEQ